MQQNNLATAEELSLDHSSTNVPVVVSFDNNFVKPATISLFSLFKNANKKHTYNLYILHSDITEENQNLLKKVTGLFKNVSVEFINMNNLFADLWSNKGSFGYTKEVIYKIKVSSIFPNLDRLIFTDVDVVYLNDPFQSYFINMDNFYFAGIKPVGKVMSYYNYYNNRFPKNELDKFKNIGGGFLVINNKKIKDDGLEVKMLEFLKKNIKKLVQLEQDVINYCAHGKIKLLPLKYMVCSYMYDLYKNPSDFKSDSQYTEEELVDAMNNPIHLHYAGMKNKPWKNKCAKDDVWSSFENELGLALSGTT